MVSIRSLIFLTFSFWLWKGCKSFSFLFPGSQSRQPSRPNIVFVLVDDVGFNDIGYNNNISTIPTLFIDKLALDERSFYLDQYYVHPLCTPTRASLMTGRYSINTGLTSVIFPGSPVGLPIDAPTLPQMLKTLGYRTYMAGKWHLGSSQRKQSAIGKGFDEFTGINMGDADYFTKQVHLEPWAPLLVDWVEEYANGSYRNFANPQHTTDAITTAALKMIQSHATASHESTKCVNYTPQKKPQQQQEEDARVESNASGASQCEEDKMSPPQLVPMFLYVAFTAAHSPLQPLAHHAEKCAHIPHSWRRDFCGLVVGMDEAVNTIATAALSELGSNTILIFSSDNGGSPWFGGMNAPLRGAKTSPFEGGVRVPAFVTDFSSYYFPRRSSSKDNKISRRGREKGNNNNSSSSNSSNSSNSNSTKTSRNDISAAHATPSTSTNDHTSSTGVNMTTMGVQGVRGMMKRSSGHKVSALMHVSDWMPTILSLAGMEASALPTGLDGVDMTPYLQQLRRDRGGDRKGASRAPWGVMGGKGGTKGGGGAGEGELVPPRTEMLVDMVPAMHSLFGEEVMAYRWHNWKLVVGFPRDPYWYAEPASDRLQCSDPSGLTGTAERALRVLEWLWGPGPFDGMRISLTHNVFQSTMAAVRQWRGGCWASARPTKFGCHFDRMLLASTTDPTKERGDQGGEGGGDREGDRGGDQGGEGGGGIPTTFNFASPSPHHRDDGVADGLGGGGGEQQWRVCEDWRRATRAVVNDDLIISVPIPVPIPIPSPSSSISMPFKALSATDEVIEGEQSSSHGPSHRADDPNRPGPVTRPQPTRGIINPVKGTKGIQDKDGKVNADVKDEYAADGCTKYKLFDLAVDPTERRNVADEHPAVVALLLRKLLRIKRDMPPQADTSIIVNPEKVWRKMLVKGDCSMATGIAPHDCVFERPWIADDVAVEDVWKNVSVGRGMIQVKKFASAKSYSIVVLLLGTLFFFVMFLRIAAWSLSLRPPTPMTELDVPLR